MVEMRVRVKWFEGMVMVVVRGVRAVVKVVVRMRAGVVVRSWGSD